MSVLPMSAEPEARGGEVDLSNCDREPIHVIENIQPHGVLIALDRDDLRVAQVSESCAAHLGISAEALLGLGLEDLVEEAEYRVLRAALLASDIEGAPTFCATAPVCGAGPFHVIAHRHDGVVILELERALPARSGAAMDFYALVQGSLRRLDSARSLDTFMRLVAEEARRITGHDRVMVYRFLHDGSGEVMTEAQSGALPTLVGLRYPASDLPQQARALYRVNAVRVIADACYAPARLIPALNPRTGRPLDLTHARLRGVSKMHLEYLANMGVRASLSLALTAGDTLWGLIACHHVQGPLPLGPEPRAACELLARVASLQLTEKEARESVEYEGRLRTVHDALVERLSRSAGLFAALVEGEPSVLSFVHCEGAAVLSDGDCRLLGKTPSEENVRALVEWVADECRDEVFVTDALPSVYPPAASFQSTACGVLAVRITRASREYVLWFRPEVIETVHWAGDPSKPTTEDGGRLTPRRSFELWKETVRGRSRPFLPLEVDAVRRLRGAMTELVFRRNEQLAALNSDLTRSNEELDAFVYAASHDLKEPLRGIHNFSAFLLEDYGAQLDTPGRSKLETLMRLTRRMQTLIDSLLRFSRVGRSVLVIEPVDMNKVLVEVQEALSTLLAETSVEISVPRPLPVVQADRSRLQEVIENLVSNAAKYNDKPVRRVEIGWESAPQPEGPVRLWVRDNGIGIPSRHYETIFRIFKRLHPEHRFGGGTGAGLTIAKKLIEMHGGRIWLESVEGVGTTFWFTLAGEGP